MKMYVIVSEEKELLDSYLYESEEEAQEQVQKELEENLKLLNSAESDVCRQYRQREYNTYSKAYIQKVEIKL